MAFLSWWFKWSKNAAFTINDKDQNTFNSQSSSIIPYRQSNGNIVSGKYIYVGDNWNANKLSDSRPVWLPLNLNSSKQKLTMKNYTSWSPAKVFK